MQWRKVQLSFLKSWDRGWQLSSVCVCEIAPGRVWAANDSKERCTYSTLLGVCSALVLSSMEFDSRGHSLNHLIDWMPLS